MTHYPRFSGFYLSLCKFFFLNVWGILFLFGFEGILEEVRGIFLIYGDIFAVICILIV